VKGLKLNFPKKLHFFPYDELFFHITNYFAISRNCVNSWKSFMENDNRRILAIRDASPIHSALLPHRLTYQRLQRLPRGLEIATSPFSTAMISHRARLVAARESQTKGEWQTQTSTSVSDPIFYSEDLGGSGCSNRSLSFFFSSEIPCSPRNDAFPSVVGDEYEPCPTAKTVQPTVQHKSI